MTIKKVVKFDHFFLLLKLLENVAEVDLGRDERVEILNLYTLLLDCVAGTDCHAAVIE